MERAAEKAGRRVVRINCDDTNVPRLLHQAQGLVRQGHAGTRVVLGGREKVPNKYPLLIVALSATTRAFNLSFLSTCWGTSILCESKTWQHCEGKQRTTCASSGEKVAGWTTPGPRDVIRDLDVQCRVRELRRGYAYCDLFVFDAAGMYEIVPLLDGPPGRTGIRRRFPIYERGHPQVTSAQSEASASADSAMQFQ